MAREAIKLNVEEHGTKIRYKKQFKNDRWRSKSYDADTRENKRQAWADFVEWRKEKSASKQSECLDANDPYSLHRVLVAERFRSIIEHAELTGNPTEAATFRTHLANIPSMNRDTLFEATAFVAGEYGGRATGEIIEDRARTVEQIKDSSNPNLNCKTLADEYILRLRRKAENNQGSYGHYGQVKRALEVFVEWYGVSRSLEHVTEKTIRDYTAYLDELLIEKKIARNTAFNYQAKFRKWMTDLAEDYPEVPLPKNLRSKSQRIPTERKEPNPFTLDEVQLLLSNASDRTKLYLCLMLNCAMYQGDIADLNHKEIDWVHGRIIRPRSKTARQSLTTGKGEPFRCNWSLWPITWKLFQEFANREGLCLRSKEGNPLIVNKTSARTDTIRSAFVRLVKKLKNRGLLSKDWNKTLKQFRKTGANLIESSDRHGQFYTMYLNHSVAKQSYLTSGKPVPTFDAAIKWLGEQIFPNVPKK
jgi:integrase